MMRRLWFVGVLALVFVATGALAATWTISWQDNSSDESGFKVERRVVPSGSYNEIATVGPNVTTYVDSTATNGWVYRYRVRAWNAAGNSPYSNEGCAPPPCVPTVPTGVSKAP
jgi:hypothetical protein